MTPDVDHRDVARRQYAQLMVGYHDALEREEYRRAVSLFHAALEYKLRAGEHDHNDLYPRHEAVDGSEEVLLA